MIRKTQLQLLIIATFSYFALSHSIQAMTPKQAVVKKIVEKTKKWDVNHPPYSTHEIKINVESGTWMSVDVSPDGKQIVFDLLGDIYLLPVRGGKAKALTTTISWEMQPRFSPDGKHIAFTSDQGGGDNIWIMDLEGKHQKQITREKFRLLNNPNWSPDGRFIVARKHFTGTRSLGAGELWLYSINGGSGIRMNEAPTQQKDLGEPAFSSDGRYVYFSQDVTPGKVFEYSKDSNGIIYAIKRLDTQSGKIIDFIREPGGSVRPTPSPDGKSLAFVKRVRNKTALFIKDLTSGIETMLCDCLERDMQETWAIHGVYPNIAWLPDSKSLVFWAKGKIHRINVATKKVARIDFQVNHTRQVADALRFKNKAFSEKQMTKMLRWMTVTPDEKNVVFQALGQIYIKNLSTGKLKQLTNRKNEEAFYPAISSDGRWITYVSWNDEKLGAVRKMSISGKRNKKLTRQPGHYLEPRFSADGRTVYFKKTSGGYLLSPDWSLNTGLYQIDAAGKNKPEKLPFNGNNIQTGVDGRLYVTQFKGRGKTRKANLVAWDGKTAKSQIVAQTHFGSEFSLSADGNWLAFVDGFNAYIAPFRPSGKIIQLSAKNAALPVVKISTDAGENIHWSGDSHTVYWSSGNQLFHQSISASLFSKKANSDNKEKNSPPENSLSEDSLPENPGQVVGFSFRSAKPHQTIALIHARIITMENDGVIEDGTLIIKDNIIQDVGKAADVKLSASIKTFDMKGKTIMPGIVDAHWHGSQGQNEIIPQQNWKNLTSLSFGVTTIHDPSNDTSEIFAASEMAKAGKIIAPRIFSTGMILYGAKANIFAEVNNLDDARRHVRRMKAAGAFSVKSYNQPRRDQRQQILEAAREEKMEVFPEGGSLFQHNMNMIVDGHTGIEHSIPVANVYEDVKQLWSQTKVGYTPTLIVGYGGIFGENYWYQHTEVWKHPILSKWVPPSVLIPRSVRRTMAPEADYNHVNNARVVKELANLGVEVHIGAHGQREGLGAHWEMWILAQGGMKPMDILKVATISGAKYLGMDEQIGSIKKGKLADLVILDVNPLEDIYQSDKVHAVMINGRLFDAQSLKELTGKWQPEKFYWQYTHNH